MRCPVCGKELIEVGYPKEFYREYRCPNGCKFDLPLSWRVRNAIGVAVTLILFTLVSLILAIGYVVSLPMKVKVKNKA